MKVWVKFVINWFKQVLLDQKVIKSQKNFRSGVIMVISSVQVFQVLSLMEEEILFMSDQMFCIFLLKFFLRVILKFPYNHQILIWLFDDQSGKVLFKVIFW
jgi:hypothetical protein